MPKRDGTNQRTARVCTLEQDETALIQYGVMTPRAPHDREAVADLRTARLTDIEVKISELIEAYDANLLGSEMMHDLSSPRSADALFGPPSEKRNTNRDSGDDVDDSYDDEMLDDREASHSSIELVSPVPAQSYYF